MIEQKPTIDFNDVWTPSYYTSGVTNGDVITAAVTMLVQQCHAASYNRGWWHDPITGLSLIPSDLPAPLGAETMRRAWFPYVLATKIALIHSETSEGLEALRVDKMDDKIPEFAGITAEMADVVIRVCDLMGCIQWYNASVTSGEVPLEIAKYNLGAAIMAKLPFNAGRVDHDLSKRTKPGGKLF
jgi:hypothetical protein